MDENENIYAQFVIEKLENAGGCLKFQHITGHLSQLDEKVRRAVGTKPFELKRFLENHDNLFDVDMNGMVSLKKCPNNNLRSSRYSSDCDSAFPSFLKEKDGIVIKVLPNFGFIATKTPKTSIYFTPACFETDKKSLLTDLVECGQKVCFNARRGDTKFESKYQAVKVWIPEKVENEVLHPGGFKKRKTRDTGLFDPPTLEGAGKVQKVFPNYGFIIVDDDPKNTVFFTKSNLCNVQNLLDLTKVVNIDDNVEFKAMRSIKKDSTARWQANKVWLKGQKTKEEMTRELKKNELGKIYPNANGAVIKFGSKLEYLADADSCLFYVHGTKVTDVCWEFSDGDNVVFDAIKIKSAPGWKALICWVGNRPDIVLPVDLGDFTAFPDEEMNDITETGSFASSEVSHSSTSRNAKSSKVHETHYSSKQRNSRDNKKSDFRGSRSLSRSSKTSQQSNSNVKNNLQNSKSKEFKNSGRTSNSKSLFRYRFESDSGIGSDHYVPRKQKISDSIKDPQDSNDDYEDIVEDVPPKSSSWLGNVKKNDKEKIKSYTNWGDSPYPEEDIYESDLDRESVLSEETSYLEKNSSDNEKPGHSKYDKYEEVHSNDGFSVSELDYKNDIHDIENVYRKHNPEEEDENFQEADDTGLENMLEETSKDEDALVCEEPQIQPYIKRFSELSGKVMKVYCKYAEIESELLKKSASFFWTDFYCNGRPAPDHFDDLKEVLREGHTIKFNCIEIVDDSGSCWHKITMAWKGQKPKITEMTPTEFIFENSLFVSASENLNEYEGIDSSFENTEKLKPAAPVRKFLTIAVEDDGDEDSPDSISEPPEEAIVKIEPSFSRQELPSPLSDSLQDSASPLNMMQLTEMVGKMLISYRHSETDVDMIASDMINFVLSRAEIKNIPRSAAAKSSCEKESQTENVTFAADLEYSSASHEVVFTETSVQTIITGDVIAQSIFTL